jgi:hypothetical protein
MKQSKRGLGDGWLHALVSSLLLGGCVVSFDDYPVGHLDGAPSSGSGAFAGDIGAGGTGKGGAGSGGTAGLATGGSSQGGTGAVVGVGGEAGAETSTVESDPNLIDDFEDGDDAILTNDDRQGTWYVSNDGMGLQEPGMQEDMTPSMLVPTRDASRRALHTSGSGFSVWGAFVRAYLRVSGARNEPYDASGYTGVRFWARSGDDEEHSAFLMLPSVKTTTCPGCGDHFGSEFQYTSEWQEFRMPFDAMKQRGFGPPQPALVTEEIVAVQILFADDVDFDVWIDDIGFY